ncbi:CHASE3 domain-containing protein [Rubripirellula amarantea]|nr:CHASE3 domain-containing protein [Rubripirellula amarantea]MDA8744400.1 CHASE3 domain-containing protein [Rubripirellula amarantea]
MNVPSNRSYWLPIAIAAAFFAVAIFGIVTYVNTLAIRNSEKAVAHSYAIREAAQQLLSAMKDMQTGQRGFLLTGDESFLSPYVSGVDKAETEFTTLHALAESDPKLSDRVKRLRASFDEQQAHFIETIELRRAQATTSVDEQVLRLVKSGRGKAAMESARQVAKQIVETENEQLQESETHNRYLSAMSQTTITAGHLIALALILTTGLAAWLDRRKRDAAELALLKEQDELAAVIDAAFEGIVAFNDDFSIRFMNPAAADILQVNRDDSFVRSILDFVVWPNRRDDPSLNPASTNGSGVHAAKGTAGHEINNPFAVAASEPIREFDNQLMVRNDGTEFPSSGTATHTVTETERFTTVRFRDLTDFHTSLIKQREYSAILEQINDAVLVCDLDGKVRSWNSSAEQLFGLNESQMAGSHARTLISAEPEQWDRERQELLRTGRVSSQFAWKSSGGRDYVLEQRRSLIRDESGEPSGKLLFLIDITDRVRDEEKKRRTQRLESIGTLAGGIAHDLNNVLTPIVMSAKLLKRGSKTPERLLDNIVTSADRGGRMIKKLLAFAGGDEGQRTQVDLSELLLELEEILSHTLQQTIDLQVRVPEQLRKVDADSTELSQVIMNLAINARDAMPGGGRLEIDVADFDVDESRAASSDTLSAGPHVLLTVTDNGEGISSDIIDRIYDPFFTTKAQGKGTGLGLATTLGIIRSYSGDITVYSEPSVGTKFSIYLPSSKLTPNPVGASEATALPTGNNETILIVDDEPMILDTARETLESFQYNVVTATSGVEAVATFKSQSDSLNVILLDMMMPGMDGFEVKDTIRSIAPNARIIATSGLRRPGHEGGRLLDVDGFLAKPYTDEQLLRIVRKVIDQPNRMTP